jgi:DNA-binding transcriptional LysR family regulator
MTGLDEPTSWPSCAIADGGSFTEASRRMSKTQPAVSVQIKRLEDRFQTALFVRGSRGVSLTREGELLYSRCSAHAATQR